MIWPFIVSSVRSIPGKLLLIAGIVGLVLTSLLTILAGKKREGKLEEKVETLERKEAATKVQENQSAKIENNIRSIGDDELRERMLHKYSRS